MSSGKDMEGLLGPGWGWNKMEGGALGIEFSFVFVGQRLGLEHHIRKELGVRPHQGRGLLRGAECRQELVTDFRSQIERHQGKPPFTLLAPGEGTSW